jgi:hypothetical protein
MGNLPITVTCTECKRKFTTIPNEENSWTKQRCTRSLCECCDWQMRMKVLKDASEQITEKIKEEMKIIN